MEEDKPNDMVETYTFHITYPNNQPEISLKTTKQGHADKTARISQQDIKKSTTQLIRTLLTLMQTLVVRLYYYIIYVILVII